MGNTATTTTEPVTIIGDGYTSIVMPTSTLMSTTKPSPFISTFLMRTHRKGRSRRWTSTSIAGRKIDIRWPLSKEDEDFQWREFRKCYISREAISIHPINGQGTSIQCTYKLGDRLRSVYAVDRRLSLRAEVPDAVAATERLIKKNGGLPPTNTDCERIAMKDFAYMQR